MKIKRGIILGKILLLSIFLRVEAQTQYPPIEELTYIGSYNMGILWTRAGSVKFTMTKSDKYPNAVKLEAIGRSLPSWDLVFKLRDTLTSYFNEETFLPYEFSRKAHEGNYHKTFDYKWDYSKGKIYANIHRIGKYYRRDTIDILPETFDMLSVAWKARELDFEKYKPNDQIPIRILMDDKIYNLYVRYLGKDSIRVGGKKRECFVFSPLLVEGDVFKGGENMKIWVSNDEYRLPLMVEAKILVGSVKGILDFNNSKF